MKIVEKGTLIRRIQNYIMQVSTFMLIYGIFFRNKMLSRPPWCCFAPPSLETPVLNENTQFHLNLINTLVSLAYYYYVTLLHILSIADGKLSLTPQTVIRLGRYEKEAHPGPHDVLNGYLLKNLHTVW